MPSEQPTFADAGSSSSDPGIPLVFGRSTLRDVPVYDADSSPVEFELADNTNPFGAPPALAAALESVHPAGLARYPSTYSKGLRELIASSLGVQASEIVLGCGSDELIDCALRALCEPGARVAYMSPTFVMVRPFVLGNALQPVPVPLTADFDLDPEAVLREHPDLIYLCSPNNPTGTVLPGETIDAVLRAARCPVLLDEAYAEYAGASRASTAPRDGRLLVLRTLSKAWGMAGLRVGYAVGNRALISPIERVRGPFKVSALSETLAATALNESREWMETCVSRTVELRERMVRALGDLGIVPPRSHANFLLIPVTDCRLMAERLRSRGVAVRAFPNVAAVGDAIRVTVGPWEAMTRVIETIREDLP